MEVRDAGQGCAAESPRLPADQAVRAARVQR